MGLGIGRLVAAQSWEDLRSRLVSAAVLGLAVLAVTILGGAVFRLMCCAAGIIVFAEWSRMTHANQAGGIFRLARWALWLSLLAFLFGQTVPSVAILVAAALAIGVTGRGRRKAAWVVGGLVYAAVAALAPGMLRGADAAGLAVLGLVICVVWPTDIVAYFTGKTFGGPKILPSVSPKKTVSGSLGGLLAGVVFGTSFYVHVAGEFHVFIPALTAGLSILGQAGDLFESWVKRRFGVKDSGRIIPGHGGLMDRIDALVFSLGAAWIVGIVLEGFHHPARAFFNL